ncbi:MAG: site-specific integrase [Chloroflexi bacterium]|nr:site-specific integrase [Chloroflexota bacterium]
MARGNNEGTVYKRKDGRWCAAVTVNGRQRYVYARTRQAAAEQLARALADVQSGLSLPSQKLTVRDYLSRWLDDAAKPKVRPRTFESYSMIVNRHLIPSLGRVPLAKLSPVDAQRYLNAKLESGLSAKTVANHRAVLRRALGQALKWGLVARNVATLVDPPRVERHEVEPLSADEARQLLAAAQGHRLEALFTVALALGLRQGEALGLRWEDVDLDTCVLRVRRQLQRIGHAWQLTEPKTARSRRALALPGFAVEALRRHKVRQLEEQLAGGAWWTGNAWGLVFTSEAGTPIEGSNLHGVYRRLLAKAGVQPRRFHDLRHSCATLLLEQGEDLRTVMEVLGHSQISLTANTYQHVRASLLKGAADRMQALLGGAR